MGLTGKQMIALLKGNTGDLDILRLEERLEAVTANQKAIDEQYKEGHDIMKALQKSSKEGSSINRTTTKGIR